MAYLEPAELREKPWEVSALEADDALLAKLIRSAQEYIEAFCRMRFEPEEKTIRLRGSGSTTLFLPERLITATSVRVNGVEVSGFTNHGWYLSVNPGAAWTFEEPTDVELNVEVSGTWGLFSAVPQAIKDACAKLVLRALRPRERLGVFRSERIGDYSYEVETGTGEETGDREIDRVLKAFRKRRLQRPPVAVSPRSVPDES